jgi:hypothetical protein
MIIALARKPRRDGGFRAESAVTGGQEWCEGDISVVLAPLSLIMPSAAGPAGRLLELPRTGDATRSEPRRRRDHEMRLQYEGKSLLGV